MVPEIAIDRFEIFANGRDHPECLAFDREGVLWAGGEAGQIYRISKDGKVETVVTLGGFSGGIYRLSRSRGKTLYAYDRWTIPLSRPTNLQFHDGYLYVANLGRTTITRARVGVAGKPLANGV